MWSVYVWLWANVPIAAFTITGLFLILFTGTISSILEPRYYFGELERPADLDPPRPAPRTEPPPRVWGIDQPAKPILGKKPPPKVWGVD